MQIDHVNKMSPWNDGDARLRMILRVFNFSTSKESFIDLVGMYH